MLPLPGGESVGVKGSEPQASVPPLDLKPLTQPSP